MQSTKFTNRFINLAFAGGNSSTATVNVPFNCHTVIIKPLVSTIDGALVHYLLTDMFPNTPVIGLYMGGNASALSSKCVTLKYDNPISFNGFYTFLSKTIANADSAVTGNVIVQMEFIG